MRILSASEVDKKKREQEDFRIQKAERLNDLVREGTVALNDLRDQDRRERERLARQFIEFSNEIGQRRTTLEAEVCELEDRKSKVLESVEVLQAEAAKKLEEAVGLGMKLQERQEELDLQEKELSETRAELSKKEEALLKRESASEEEQGIAVALRMELDQRRKEFEDYESFYNKKLEVERNELAVRAQALANEKAEITAQRRWNEDQKARNEEDRTRLNDRASTLQSAFEELKQKNK